jgi:Predicted unusual protein kinase
MAAELGVDWEKKFRSFEHTGAGAGSLGQVHRAESKSGAALACKLQYPDMRSVVEADLKQLKFIFSVY